MRYLGLLFLALFVPCAAGAAQFAAGAFLRGTVAMSRGDYDAAADGLAAAYDTAPTNPNIGEQALAANLLAGRPDTVPIARQIVQTLPGDPVAQLVLAGTEAAAGHWQEAAQHDSAMAPDSVYAALRQPLLAWAQFGAGRRDAMRALLRPQRDQGTPGGAFLLQQALMEDIAGHPADAERLYISAEADLGPTDFTLDRALASLQARQGRQADALKTLAAASDPDLALDLSAARLRATIAQPPVRDAGDATTAIYVSFAMLARLQSAPDIADTLLRLAINLRPGLSYARLELSAALASESRFQSALAVLAPVTAGDPLAPSADFIRAKLQARCGNVAESLAILAALQAANPDNAAPWSLQADIQRDQHRDAEAVTAYTHAIALRASPQWRDYFGRAVAEEHSGPWPAAEADFRAALRLAPDEPTILNHLGLALTKRNTSLDRARELFEHAARLQPDDATIADSLGQVQLRAGDIHAAIRSFEHAAELRPADPASNAHLGDAYAAAGRKLEAEFQWRQAASLQR